MRLIERLSLIPKVMVRPEIYMMILRIYIPILFPSVFIMGYISRLMDRASGFDRLVPLPLNYLLGSLFIIAGLSIVGLSYSYLVFKGDGSPSPFVRHTQRLVRDGIYSVCRNPSIWGKLAGVIGFGLIIDSPAFLFLFIPILLAGSLWEKRARQEPLLIEMFGEEYLEYRRSVPFFVPRLKDLPKIFH